jgi:hypothetical protein
LFSGRWLYGETLGQNIKFEITARVTNIGVDGVIEIITFLGPESVEVNGTEWKSTQIYLVQGEEKAIHFNFWTYGPLGYIIQYQAYCI